MSSPPLLDRSRLRALAEQATSGPWTVTGATTDGSGCGEVTAADGLVIAWCGMYSVKERQKGQDDYNAEFIAAARNAILSLLDAADERHRLASEINKYAYERDLARRERDTAESERDRLAARVQ
jgi:hypothetical protein